MSDCSLTLPPHTQDNYYERESEEISMRIRKQPLGDRNICGKKVEARRKEIGMKQKDLLTQLQIRGVDLNASGLSKLEGQLRSVSDFEIVALAEVLNTNVSWLLDVE